MTDQDRILEEMISRAQVRQEALSWIGTPYFLRGQIKQVGVDCGSFLMCVYRNCGFKGIPTEHECKSHDWWCHEKNGVYEKHLMELCLKVFDAIAYRTLSVATGNIVAIKSRSSTKYNHSGIVVGWPKIVHVMYDGAKMVDATTHPFWANAHVTIWDIWRKA